MTPFGRLLIVGVGDVVHVGAHLSRAAEDFGVETRFADSRDAFGGPRWLRTFNWRFRGHRPSRLRPFSRSLVEACAAFRPRWLLATGVAPVEDWALEAVGKLGVERLNYLTDDPWNRAHRAEWFLRALPLYDHVFSPRRSNLDDLRRAGCREVSYLPFAYAPDVHFHDPPTDAEEHRRFGADVVFAGGADRDRLPWISALASSGLTLALYGGHWARMAGARPYARGHADPFTLRKAIGGARVALGLVRRANRDGHAMRSFEVPAMGGCMVAEDTVEHRELFGPEGESVLYFRTVEDLVAKTRRLVADDGERRRLTAASHERICRGRHRYADRIETMLDGRTRK